MNVHIVFTAVICLADYTKTQVIESQANTIQIKY